MICQDVTKAGVPCPANAMRKADPDGRKRCPQHSVAPAMREAIRLSRERAGLVSTGQKPAEVTFERFETAEALDGLFDEGLVGASRGAAHAPGRQAARDRSHRATC